MTACSGQSTRPRPLPPPPISSTSPSTASSTPRAGVAGQTVWLCRPGHQPDPCVSDLTTTPVLADGSRQQTREPGARAKRADCFYGYPPVGGAQQANADLGSQRAQRQVALVQAA